MKNILIPIDQAGRIVLPKKVRQELDLQAGDMLKLSMEGTRVTLAVSDTKAGFQRKGNALVFTTMEAGTFGHEIVDALLSELRADRLLPAVSERPARKRKQ